MAFRIPNVQNGSQVQSASQAPTVSPFGQAIQQVIKPAVPTTSDFNHGVAGDLAIAKIANQASDILQSNAIRAHKLRVAADIQSANTALAEWQNNVASDKNYIAHESKKNNWSGAATQSTLDGSLKARSEQAITTASFKDNPLVFSQFKTKINILSKTHEIRNNAPNGLVETSTISHLQNNIFKSLQAQRQTAAACGTYECMLTASHFADNLKNDPAVVAALGLPKLDALIQQYNNNVYTDHIIPNIHNDPASEIQVLHAVKNKQFLYYPNLDPKQRDRFLAIANQYLKLKLKNEAKNTYVKNILGPNPVGDVPGSNTKYKKIINNAFDQLTTQLQAKPENERYNIISHFVTKTQIIPDALKLQISHYVNSEDPTQMNYALELTNKIVHQDPQLSKQLPENIIVASALHEAGATNATITTTIKQLAGMPENILQDLKKSYKAYIVKNGITDVISKAQNAVGPVGFFSDDPHIDQEFKSNARELFNQYYIATKGNVVAAQTLTNKTLKNEYGITTVGSGKHIMRYPPEKMDNNINNDNWMNDQAIEDTKKSTGIDLTKQQWFVEPTNGAIKHGAPMYNIYIMKNGFAEPVLNKHNVPIIWGPDVTKTAKWITANNKLLQSQANAREYAIYKVNNEKYNAESLYNNYKKFKQTHKQDLSLYEDQLTVLQHQLKHTSHDLTGRAALEYGGATSHNQIQNEIGLLKDKIEMIQKHYHTYNQMVNPQIKQDSINRARMTIKINHALDWLGFN